MWLAQKVLLDTHPPTFEARAHTTDINSGAIEHPSKTKGIRQVIPGSSAPPIAVSRRSRLHSCQLNMLEKASFETGVEPSSGILHRRPMAKDGVWNHLLWDKCWDQGYLGSVGDEVPIDLHCLISQSYVEANRSHFKLSMLSTSLSL